MMTDHSLRISTPGRVCLFGEHQDYLMLPVVPCAISLRVGIEGTKRRDRLAVLNLPDIGSRETFSLAAPLPYGNTRDYLRSSLNVLLRHGYTFSCGVECTVHGTIPINSGTSSSSALLVAWMRLLATTRAESKNATFATHYIMQIAGRSPAYARYRT